MDTEYIVAPTRHMCTRCPPLSNFRGALKKSVWPERRRLEQSAMIAAGVTRITGFTTVFFKYYGGRRNKSA